MSRATSCSLSVGRTCLQQLAQVVQSMPAHTRLDSDFFVFTAHWPDLWAATIVGPDDRGPQSRGIVEHEVVFHSSDGGASWSVDG